MARCAPPAPSANPDSIDRNLISQQIDSIPPARGRSRVEWRKIDFVDEIPHEDFSVSGQEHRDLLTAAPFRRHCFLPSAQAFGFGSKMAVTARLRSYGCSFVKLEIVTVSNRLPDACAPLASTDDILKILKYRDVVLHMCSEYRAGMVHWLSNHPIFVVFVAEFT